MIHKYNRLERKLILELYRSDNGLDLYTLFRRSRVGFSTFFNTANGLESRGVITSDAKKKYSLTVKFREMVATKAVNFSYDKDQSFRQVPCRFTTPKLSINEMYVPSVKRLDSAIIKP